MRRGHKNSSSPGSVNGGPITVANYGVRANAFIRAKGLPPDEDGIHHPGGYVIRPGSARWTAWLEYFDSKGIRSTFIREHGVATVPAVWPHEFEPRWVISTPPAPTIPAAKPYDPRKDPWLQNARWEMGTGADGKQRSFAPGHEVDRCWRDHLRKSAGLPPPHREAFPWLPDLKGASERERIIDGSIHLRREIGKMADHMDISNLRDSKGPTNWRGMSPSDAETHLSDLAEKYRSQPTTLSAEALAGEEPF